MKCDYIGNYRQLVRFRASLTREERLKYDMKRNPPAKPKKGEGR